MKPGDVLPQLALHFALLSLIAVGGAPTIMPEMHRWLVEQEGWLTSAEFANFFAIAQVAPGPNILIVSLVGWKLAGLTGALVATLAACLPSGALAYGVGQVWHRFRGAPWRAAVQTGLAPLTVGLILATGYILARAADQGIGSLAIAAGTVVLVMLTRLHPLCVLAGAGVLGAMGWL
jgi:chromate transporter